MNDLTVPPDQLPDPVPIEPLPGPFDATITPPGSKSLTCRAYVLAALAEGESRIAGPLRADDTERLLAALGALGAQTRPDGDDVLIRGVGGRFPRGGSLDLGDGGAPTRFMIAAACLATEPVVVDGSPRMRQRPVAELVELLRGLGADVQYVEAPDRLPVRTVPNASLRGGRLAVGRTQSSQSISALMLVAPWLEAGLRLDYTAPVTSEPYVALTRAILRQWGADVGGDAGERPPHDEIRPGGVTARTYAIEPDASSAAYWLTAAAIAGAGARTRIEGIGRVSPQPDARFAVDGLGALGAAATANDRSLEVRGARVLPGGVAVDLSIMPDAAMCLAVAAARCANTCLLTGLETLRVKETDRIDALTNELRRIGCGVHPIDEAISIDPAACHDEPLVIDTYNDHRMAMAFAVLGLARPGISIRNPGCVSKSYPGFWRDLARLYD